MTKRAACLGAADRVAPTACPAPDRPAGVSKFPAAGLLPDVPEVPLVWGVRVRPLLGGLLLQERTEVLPKAAELCALHARHWQQDPGSAGRL